MNLTTHNGMWIQLRPPHHTVFGSHKALGQNITRQMASESILVEWNKALIALTIVADGHDCCSWGSEMVRRMWWTTSDSGRDKVFIWEKCTREVLIYKTISCKITLSKDICQYRPILGEKWKTRHLDNCQLVKGSPLLIVHMLTHICPKVGERVDFFTHLGLHIKSIVH